MAASSPRSSTTPTRQAGRVSLPSDRAQIMSRSNVVLPAPGGASSSVLENPSGSHSSSTSGSDIPRIWRLMRTVTEEMSRRLVLMPARRTAVPHTPMRKPPRPMRYPLLSVSDTA